MKQMTREELNKYVEMGDIKYGEEITTERAIAEVYRWIRVVVGESYDYEILTPKVLDMVIQALSTESKCIPVSERLPNFNEAVLAQELYKKIALMNKKSFNNFIEQLNRVYKKTHKSEEE